MRSMAWAILNGIGKLEAITLASVCVVIVVAVAILRACALNGPAGFVFFLLIFVSPFFFAISVSISVWRLMTRVLPSRVGIPERLLLALASFVLVGGCGPLALYLAVLLLTHDGGSIGAAGVWALVAVFLTGLLCTFAGVIFVGRIILDRLHTQRG